MQTILLSKVLKPALKSKIDAKHLAIYGLIVLFIYGFSYFQIEKALQALYFCLGLLATFILLWVISKALMILTKKIFDTRWSYITRQGIANQSICFTYHYHWTLYRFAFFTFLHESIVD